ncbi:hypothetical protein KC909_03720, partial [Candidatus Dojkabacteria bacterium]|nr:hypothetical protein [Candidatus Dojkabacteria bacterium]
MAIRPTTPEFVIPGKGKTGNDSEKDNGLVSPAFKKQENDPEVQRALAAARAAELKAKIEASQDKKAKVSKVKQLIGLFRAYAPKSERKLKDEVVDQVSDIARRVDQADDETLSRYEQTVKEKLQLVENDQVAEILEEVAELDKLEQARPELTRLDNLSSSKKKMVSELSDGSEKKSREVEKSMVAAANLLQEKTKDIPESKTIVEAIKDTMVSIRVELGKKFQGWSENEVKAYLARAYKGDITKIEAKLAQIMPEDSEIRAEEIEREVKKAEEQEPVVALKVKEVLAPKSEADLADQMKEVGREALNALVESYQPTDEDTHQTRTAIAKQKVSYRFNRALNFDPAVNGVSEYVISDEQIDAMVDDAYSETGLDPEKISTRSLTKKKTEFEIGATKNALKRRMSALNKQREVYLEGAFEASDELEHIKPQIPPASEDEEGTINANLEKFHTLDIEQQRTIEAAGTMRLRNYLIEQGLNKKRQLLEGGEYAHTVDEVMDELRGASLDDITVEFTDEGIAVLRFTNIEDLAKFDQTIDKNGKLVYQNYQYDHETYENPDNQQFVLGTAFVQEGFFATHVDGDAILDEHEQAHLKKEYDRQIRLDYIENRTRESIAEYLIERSADSDFNFGDDLEKLSDHIGFVLKQEDMENARGWGFDVDMLKQINQLVEKGEAGELEGDEAKMYRYFNRMKSVAEAMATEASQKAHSEELGTSLMTLPMYNETSLTLASAGIFKDGEKKYDTSKETHLASLALVRYLNTLADNNRELFVEKQLAIAGLVLRKDKLTLHDVASIIQEIETNELFAGLAPERTENFDEEAQKYVNADIDDTVKMQAFFDAYGLENHPGNISLTSEEFNLLYRLFILEGKVPSFEPTELEVTEEQIHEFDETPNFSHHSFMRQYFQDPTHGIFSRDLHRPTLFPVLVTRGAPWPLRSFDLPGTGDKGFATIAHFLPQGLRNFMYFGNEGLEKIDPDKIIPFGLADNPRLAGVVEWLKGFNKYEDPKHLRQLGAFERYVLNIQTTRGTIVNTLHVTNNQADLALTKIGGIEVDWYKGQQTFRIEDLNEKDEYRGNKSLDMFVRSTRTRPNLLARELGKVNQNETITVAGSATPVTWPPAGSNEIITKGTITDGLMDEILGTMYATEITAGSSAKDR